MFNQLQTQKLQHKILPQHIALLNLMHLDALSLEQRIETEIYENPALEEMMSGEDQTVDKFSKEAVQDFQNWEEYGYDDIPDYKTEYRNYLPSDKMPDRQLADTLDFRSELKKQFRFTDACETQLSIADFIIDSLDEHGFLNQDLESLAEQISFRNKVWLNPEDLEKVRRAVLELDPAGAGSRNVKEFLLIQLDKMDQSRTDVSNAQSLLKDFYPDMCSANLEKIRREMKIGAQEVRTALQLLSTLGTRPISGSESNLEALHTKVSPDFIISMESEALQVALSRQRSASLQVSGSWAETVQTMDQDKSTAQAIKQYMRSKLNAAQWFINALRERETNMLKVIKAIVCFQNDYFQCGDSMMLKPMALKNIAKMVDLDISTVSRITSNKYADTPFGIILLKDLFTEGLMDKEGNSISNEVIRTLVEELVGKEDKKNPLTDQKLADILSDKGYNVARRTIAKYREQLKIPVAQVRAIRSSME
jgi:RNA polymerase sigma-54 factor